MKSWSSIVSGNVSNSASKSAPEPTEDFPALITEVKTNESQPSEPINNNEEFKPVRSARNKRPREYKQPRVEREEQASSEPKTSRDKNFTDRLEVEKRRYLDKFKQEKDNLCFELIKGDLFSVNSDVSLAHCVSEDFKMSKGIATEFKKRFGNVDELLKQGAKTGGCAYIKHENRYVFYLITKKLFYFKPYYSALDKALKELCKLCLRLNVSKLAMPMVGTGLDQLEWSLVSRIIDDAFFKSNIQLFIYKFERRQNENSKIISE
ncbi:unnamed protein product [Brachionus calyciflorus]|uniref:Macro domain-containing protein n=1 Tax=Brachionus calyciflorus TaxID=104777 RepID=A0A813NER6_9BILA|nr:unnamed protein product [Brachionus calyciflorus]